MPNRRASDPTNAFLPEGLTVATNAPVYTVGHYNADGTLLADRSDMTTPEANEVPAAIIADAISVLSSKWDTTDFVTGEVVLSGDINSNSSFPSQRRSYRGFRRVSNRHCGDFWNGKQSILEGR